MTQIILFDVDGVLIHGYHYKTELQKHWDKNLYHDFGIERDIFKNEFILEDFTKKFSSEK